MAQTEERRDLARGSILATQDRQIETRQRDLDRRQEVKYQPGDLVLLRRFAVDKDKGKKLEAKWEGPYRITRITKSEVSVWLEDLCTGMRKGRYSIDDLKIYVAREHMVRPEGHIRLDGGQRKEEIAGVLLVAKWRGKEV